ncbi:MAG: thiolase family protein [Chloroflexi bacterium]|nr:thiolase family protein [Chloroflexota bacterium]
MRFEHASIPLGGAWSSPFTRWQGSLAEVNALDLAVDVTSRALDERQVDRDRIERLVLGWTVPQPGSFYGAPTVAARLGLPGVTGPMLSQACATSAICLEHAAAGIEQGEAGLTLVLATDRTSNGPLLLHPAPSSAGGAPSTEHWVLDNFQADPNTGQSMLQTAENVAEEIGVTREELDEVTLLRYRQYDQALAHDRAFQKRYFVPAALPGRKRGVPQRLVEADEGIFPTSAEGLAALKPVLPEGVVTFGMQTHPADGTAGALVTTEEQARQLSQGEGVARILGSGVARAEKARMPKAPVPAARKALAAAGLTFADVDLVTTHNPFAVNDVYFHRESGIPLERMNVYGCSLVWGHPQGPTGLRAIAELIETLRLRGGGIGLFTGCAAGDTGAAIVLRVGD